MLIARNDYTHAQLGTHNTAVYRQGQSLQELCTALVGQHTAATASRHTASVHQEAG